MLYLLFSVQFILQSVTFWAHQPGGIKIVRRNINNLRYADDTPLWQKVNRN